jgi:hypothetical protein
LNTDMLPMSASGRRQPNGGGYVCGIKSSCQTQTHSLRKPSGDGRNLTSKNKPSAFHSSISSPTVKSTPTFISSLVKPQQHLYAPCQAHSSGNRVCKKPLVIVSQTQRPSNHRTYCTLLFTLPLTTSNSPIHLSQAGPRLLFSTRLTRTLNSALTGL